MRSHKTFTVWLTWPGIVTYFQQDYGEGGQVATKRIKDELGLRFIWDGMLKHVWQSFVNYRLNHLEAMAGQSYVGTFVLSPAHSRETLRLFVMMSLLFDRGHRGGGPRSVQGRGDQDWRGGRRGARCGDQIPARPAPQL